jgi:hypothetical protein
MEGNSTKVKIGASYIFLSPSNTLLAAHFSLLGYPEAAAMDLDVVVLDFEDGVALNSKADARRLVKEALAQHSFGRAEKLIRINSVRSGYELYVIIGFG